MATTSPMTCCAKRHTRGSARPGAGCCTGASPRAWNCSTPRTRTASRPSSPSSTRRAGRPERAVAYYQRAADVAAGMFAHAEEIRLHEKALAIIAAMPPGRDRDSRELAVLEAMAAPLNARYGYSSPDVQQALERTVALAESLGRSDSTVAGLAALAGCAVRPGTHGRQPPDGHARAGPRRPRVRAGRAGSFRRRLFGHQPGDARPMGCVTSNWPPSWRAAPSG